MATRATAVLLHTWQRHIKSHPATRGDGKLNGQSNVLPCVFAGSVVSDTPQRLGPGAHRTVAAQGPRDSIWYTAWNRRQTPPSAPYSHEGHLPSIPEGIRDSYKLQGVYGHVLDENVYQYQYQYAGQTQYHTKMNRGILKRHKAISKSEASLPSRHQRNGTGRESKLEHPWNVFVNSPEEPLLNDCQEEGPNHRKYIKIQIHTMRSSEAQLEHMAQLVGREAGKPSRSRCQNCPTSRTITLFTTFFTQTTTTTKMQN